MLTSKNKLLVSEVMVEPFTEVEESIAIKGGKTQTVTLKFTRHGPVVAETKKHAFVVRAAWLEPGMAPYFGSIEYMRAENFREFARLGRSPDMEL